MAAKVEFEFSSGGILFNNQKVLVIKTKNLKGEKVWTFPKGHIEKTEDALTTAIREVEEETGYLCEVIKELDKVQYWFKDRNRLVKKTVQWFLMKPVKKVKKPCYEIISTKWINITEAKNILNYKSDKQLIDKILNSNY